MTGVKLPRRPPWWRGGGSCRGAHGFQPRVNLFSRRAAVGDTIRDTDAAESAAGDEEPGMAGERGIDRREPLQVPDFVLRVAAVEAVDASEQRLTAQADQGLQG